MHTIRRLDDRAWAGLVAAAFLVVWALFVHSRVYSTNEASRLAAIESLVERGVWHIDDSRFSTIDKILAGVHFYSDKPPLMAFLGAGLYAVLHHGFGWQLSAEHCVPEHHPAWCRAALDPAGTDWVYVSLVFVIVALPAALALALHYRAARFLGLARAPSLVFTGLLGLATAVFPYATVFANHVPAAAFAAVAVYICLTRPEPSPRALFAAGLAAALSVAFELSAAIFFAGLTFYLGLRARRPALWFLAGSALPLLLSAALNWQIVGNLWPPQFYAAGYDYPGSLLYANVAGTRSPENVARYAFDMLVGARGVLAFFPVLFFYGWSLVRAAFGASQPIHRRLAWVAAGSTALYVAYVLLFTDNFGGSAYSPRWLILPVPALALAGLPGLRRLRWGHWLVLGGLGGLSLFSAFHGALSPWRPAAPLLRLAYTAPGPASAPPVVLAGYSGVGELSPELRQALGANDIAARVSDPRSAFVVPPGDAWWFLVGHLPAAPEFAAALGDGVAGQHALYADLEPAAQAWIAALRHAAAPLGAGEAPDPIVPATAVLPLTFSDELTLMGFDWTVQDSTLRLVTAWRIARDPAITDQRRLVAQVVDGSGAVLAENVALDVVYGLLRPGDLVFQVQSLPMPGPSSPTSLVLGVVEPVSGSRLLLPDGSSTLLLGPAGGD